MFSWIKPGDYFYQELGDFYQHGPNRLILYPLIFSFFLMEGIIIWLLYRGPAYYLDHMAFTTLYSLHKAAGKTLCLWIADAMAHHLVPVWGTYKNRTVGRQWIIWSIGLSAGFMPIRWVARQMVRIYAPDMAAYFKANPQELLSMTTVLLILIPCWIIAVFMTIQMALWKQKIQQPIQSRMASPRDHTSVKMTPPLNSMACNLNLGQVNGNRTIPHSDITHITVEDHYCRIHYSSGNGLKSKMIRLPLKELLLNLPEPHFLRIHRSHVLNLGYVSHLSKKGRDHKVVLKNHPVELPISRSRFKSLLKRLETEDN